MINFNQIKWPHCPHCEIVINDEAIISMRDLSSIHGQAKECPACFERFIMYTTIKISTETEKV